MMWSLLSTLGWAGQAQQLPDPRPHGSWVADEAGILPGEIEAEIDWTLDQLEQATGVEVVLVTVPQVERGSPKALATELTNTWGVGKAEANNGLLILMAMQERRLEMETGYGLEALLTDGWLGAMQQREMVPYFKQGDFAAGLQAGVQAIDSQLRLNPEAARVGAPAPKYGSAPRQDSGLGLIGGGLGGVLLLGGGVLWTRRRRRTCFEHEPPVHMELLDQEREDEHLTEGEVLEEELGSIQHDVYLCPQCQSVKRFSRSLLFSGYSRCPQCAHRTATSIKTVTMPATYVSGGLAEIHTSCMHCDFELVNEIALPRRQRSNTTSYGGGGGGGRGFGGGGGRSGGGGAGSSW